MLTSVDLRSFKCFEHLLLPLAPLTLLTGFNASGKSTVLQSLALLHQTMHENEWSNRLALNGPTVRLGTVSDVASVNGFEISVENDDVVYRWTFAGERRDMSLKVQCVAIDGEAYWCPEELRYLLPPKEAAGSVSLSNSLRNLTYILADRIGPQESYVLEDPHLVRVVGARGEHTVSVLYWGRDDPTLDELTLPGTPSIRLRQVERRMSTLFPGCEIDLQQNFRGNAVTLGLRTSKATEFHSPVHTGFGLTQVLPVIVAALSAAKGDVILLENPEVHLHPAGQAQMGIFLAEVANAGIQVVVETHSDHFLNGVRRAVKTGQLTSENVAVHFFQPVSRTLSQVESPAIESSGNIDDWPEGFFDQFDKDASYFAGWTEI